MIVIKLMEWKQVKFFLYLQVWRETQIVITNTIGQSAQWNHLQVTQERIHLCHIQTLCSLRHRQVELGINLSEWSLRLLTQVKCAHRSQTLGEGNNFCYSISTEKMNRGSHPHLLPLSKHPMQSLLLFGNSFLALVVRVPTGYDLVSCSHLYHRKFTSCAMFSTQTGT